MRAILSLSTADLVVEVIDPDKEDVVTRKSVTEKIQEQKEEDERKKEEEESSDQVDGGKKNLKEYSDTGKTQDLSDRLSDPLDGGEPNYKPRGTSNSIRDAVQIKPVSHNPRNSHER